jgi:hypothetical protein
MGWREISQKEFINYARGLGNYCTYGDALNAIEAIFSAIKQKMGEKAGVIGELLPASMKPVWDSALASGKPGDSMVELIRAYGSFPTVRDAEIALVTFFGTIKEKQARFVQNWEKRIPEELKVYWQKSKTIDEVQDATQCL